MSPRRPGRSAAIAYVGAIVGFSAVLGGSLGLGDPSGNVQPVRRVRRGTVRAGLTRLGTSEYRQRGLVHGSVSRAASANLCLGLFAIGCCTTKGTSPPPFGAATACEGTVAGRVVDPHGAPIVGARVATAYGSDATFVAWLAQLMPRVHTHRSVATYTDREGFFALHAIPAGDFSLRIHHDGFADRIVCELNLTSANMVLPPISLEPGALVGGRFQFPRQFGRLRVVLAPAVMCETSFFSSFWGETTTDSDGRFCLPSRVPADNYVLHFSPLYERDAFFVSLPMEWRVPVTVSREERSVEIASSTEAARDAKR